MNGIAEVREQYKQAARAYIEHINAKDRFRGIEFYEGRMSGLDVALSCLGVDNDEIREMYNTCKEEVEHDRIHQAATDAANQIEREQEGLDAIERPASQAQVEACGDSWIAYCDKCGKAFNSNDAVRVPYREYPGAAFSHEEVSPCCGAEYSDRPKEEAEQ